MKRVAGGERRMREFDGSGFSTFLEMTGVLSSFTRQRAPSAMEVAVVFE
jgi:hypothetical protein